MEVIYTASATAIGGREGHVSTSDNVLDLDLRQPKSKDGGSGATNPEQLFAAGFAACYNSALNLILRGKRMDVESRVTVEIDLRKDETEGYSLAARINVFIPDVEIEIARELAEKAHQMCPYSKAISGNVVTDIIVNV